MPLNDKNHITKNGIDLNTVDVSTLALVDKKNLVEELSTKLKKSIEEASIKLLDEISVKDDEEDHSSGGGPEPRGGPRGPRQPNSNRSNTGVDPSIKKQQDDFEKLRKLKDNVDRQIERAAAREQKISRQKREQDRKGNVYSSKGMSYAGDIDSLNEDISKADKKELEKLHTQVALLRKNIELDTRGQEQAILTKHAIDLEKALTLETNQRKTVLGKIERAFSGEMAIDATAIVAGLSAHSPLIGFATKYVLDKIKDHREEKNKKVNVQNQLVTKLPRQAEPEPEKTISTENLHPMLQGMNDADLRHELLNKLHANNQISSDQHKQLIKEFTPPHYIPLSQRINGTTPQSGPAQTPPQPVQEPAPQQPVPINEGWQAHLALPKKERESAEKLAWVRLAQQRQEEKLQKQFEQKKANPLKPGDSEYNFMMDPDIVGKENYYSRSKPQKVFGEQPPSLAPQKAPLEDLKSALADMSPQKVPEKQLHEDNTKIEKIDQEQVDQLKEINKHLLEQIDQGELDAEAKRRETQHTAGGITPPTLPGEKKPEAGKGGFWKNLLGGALEGLEIGGLSGGISAAFTGILKLFKMVGGGAKGLLKSIPVIGEVLLIVMALVDFFQGFMHADKMLGIDKKKLTLMNKIAGGIGGVVQGLFGIVDFILGLIGIKTDIGGFLGKGAAKLSNKAFTGIAEGFSKFIETFLKFTKFISNFTKTLANTVAKFFGFDSFKDAVLLVEYQIDRFRKWIGETFVKVIDSIRDTISDGLTTLKDKFFEILKEAGDGLASLLGFDSLTDAYNGLKDKISDALTSIGDHIADMLGPEKVQAIKDFIEIIPNVFKGIINWIKDKFSWVPGLGKAIEKKAGGVAEAMGANTKEFKEFKGEQTGKSTPSAAPSATPTPSPAPSAAPSSAPVQTPSVSAPSTAPQPSVSAPSTAPEPAPATTGKHALDSFVSSGDPALDEMMKAIATMEGNGYKNNNPGNVMDIDYAKQTGGKFRIRMFKSMQDGWKYLANLLKGKNYLGNLKNTFFDIFSKYAPKGHGGNDPDRYAKFVASKLGLDPGQSAGTQLMALAKKNQNQNQPVIASTAPVSVGGSMASNVTGINSPAQQSPAPPTNLVNTASNGYQVAQASGQNQAIYKNAVLDQSSGAPNIIAPQSSVVNNNHTSVVDVKAKNTESTYQRTMNENWVNT